MNHEAILSAGLKLARKFGVTRITREQVAQAAKCSPGLVSHYCGTMEQLRADLVQAAIDQRDVTILAFVLTDKQYKIPADLRMACLEYLA